MRLITGDETGLLKDVWVENNSATIFGDTLYQDRAQETTSLCWSNPGSSILVARKSKVVETWECISNNSDRGVWQNTIVARDLPSASVSVSSLPSTGDHVAFCRGGEICITSCDSSKAGDKATWKTQATHKKKVDTSGEMSQDVMKSRNWRNNGRNIADHRISCGAVGGGGEVVAAGGMEHDTCLIDVETGEIKWQARNVRNDHLQLRQPVWVTAMDFMPGANGEKRNDIIVIGTAFKQLRIYDVRADTKRPVSEVKEVGEYGITSLVLTKDGNQAIFGDKGGGVHPVDIRNARMAGVFSGPMGSVRSLQLHPTSPYLAAVGLDRTARVFNVNTHKLVHTSYLRQRLCSVLFDPQGVVKPKVVKPTKTKGEDSDSEEEEDFGSDSSVEYYDDGIDNEETVFNKSGVAAEDDDDEDNDEEEEEEDSDDDGATNQKASAEMDDDEESDDDDDEEEEESDDDEEEEEEEEKEGEEDSDEEEEESDESEEEVQPVKRSKKQIKNSASDNSLSKRRKKH